MKKSVWSRTAVAAAISLSLLAALFCKVNFSAVTKIILHGNPVPIAAAAAISISFNIFVGAVKWRRILRAMGYPLKFRDALSIRSAFIPLKVIFPMKSSELLKALYLEKRRDIPFAKGLSSILLDKALNGLVTLVIFFIGINFIGVRLPMALPIGLLAALLLFLFSSAFRKTIVKAASRVHTKAREFAEGLLNAFGGIGLKEKMILAAYSLIYQLSELINTYLLFRAVGILVPFMAMLAIIPFIMVVNNLPITVLGIGTREGLIVLLFKQYGAAGALLSAGILVSFIEHIIPVLFGLFYIRPFLGGLTLRKGEGAK